MEFNDNIEEDIKKIKTVLFEGNGSPPILVQLAGLNKEVIALKKAIDVDLEKSLEMKFKINEESAQAKLNELNAKMINMQHQVDNGFSDISEQIESIKNSQETYKGYGWQLVLSFIAFIGTVIAAIVSNWGNFIK